MITLSMISLLVGAALGQRFKVIVLMPVIAIVLVLVVATGVSLAQTAWTIVLMVATAATCLQIGYFVGIAIHHLRHSGDCRVDLCTDLGEARKRREATT